MGELITKDVRLEIPPYIANELGKGDPVRIGGIIQNAKTGKIVTWLKANDIEETSCWQDLGKAFSRVLSEKKKGVIVTTGLIVATATYIIHKNRKNKPINTENNYNLWVNKSIQNYLKLARDGKLNLNAIALCEDALNSLPVMTEKLYVNENLLELKGHLNTFTEQLAASCDYEIDEPEQLSESDNFVENMQANLKVQRKILEKTM